MKRLLSLLLLLILPVCALAETYEVSVQVKTDDEVFASYAKELLQKIPVLVLKMRIDMFRCSVRC